MQSCAASALGKTATPKQRAMTKQASAKRAKAISAEASVAASLSSQANGQREGFAHAFFGSICEPTPWTGLILVISNGPPNFNVARTVAWAILPSTP